MPLEAVVRQGKKTFCLVVKGKKIEPREVVLGFRGGRMVEIKAGLEVGQRVVLNPLSAIASLLQKQ